MRSSCITLLENLPGAADGTAAAAAAGLAMDAPVAAAGVLLCAAAGAAAAAAAAGAAVPDCMPCRIADASAAGRALMRRPSAVMRGGKRMPAMRWLAGAAAAAGVGAGAAAAGAGWLAAGVPPMRLACNVMMQPSSGRRHAHTMYGVSEVLACNNGLYNQ